MEFFDKIFKSKSSEEKLTSESTEQTEKTPEVIIDESGEKTQELLLQEEMERLSREYPDLPESSIRFLAEYGSHQATQELCVLGKIRNKTLKPIAVLMTTVAIGLAGWGIKEKIENHIKQQADQADQERKKWENIIATLEIPTNQLSREQAQAILDADLDYIETWDEKLKNWIKLPRIKEEDLRNKIHAKVSEIYDLFVVSQSEISEVSKSVIVGRPPVPKTVKRVYVVGLKEQEPEVDEHAVREAHEQSRRETRAMQQEYLDKKTEELKQRTK